MYTYDDDQHVANRNDGRGQRSDDFSCTPEARKNAYDAKCTEQAQCANYSHVELREERECGDGNDHNVKHIEGIAPACVREGSNFSCEPAQLQRIAHCTPQAAS